MKKCDCDERVSAVIDSWNFFMEMKDFFEKNVEEGIFKDVTEEKRSLGVETSTTLKWYECKCCGTLWEFIHPDFPTRGFVRRFSDGVYRKMDFWECARWNLKTY